MDFVPVMVALLVRLNRQYEREDRLLLYDLGPYREEDSPRVGVVVVDRLDRKTRHALQYAATIRLDSVKALHLEDEAEPERRLRQAWEDAGIRIPLATVACRGDRAACLAGYVGALPADADLTVIVPAPARMGWLDRVRHGRPGERFATALAPYRRARIVVVRDHEEPDHAPDDSTTRLLPRPVHVAVVAVDRVDRATLEAIRYARSLGASDVDAVHAVVEPGSEERLIRRWMDLAVPVPLDLMECWDRDVARAVERAVVERIGPGREITVVLPRRDHPNLRHRILHDRTSRAITRVVARYPHVDVTIVPYTLDERAEPAPSAPVAGAVG
jgi:hypothetical protein